MGLGLGFRSGSGLAWNEAPPLSHAAAYASDGPPPSTLLGLG